MFLQEIENDIYEYVRWLNGHSGTIAIVLAALAIKALFTPYPAKDSKSVPVRQIAYAIAIAVLMFLLAVTEDTSNLKLVSNILALSAEISLIRLLWTVFVASDQPETTVLIEAIGANGKLQWMTPAKKAQLRRFEGVIFEWEHLESELLLVGEQRNRAEWSRSLASVEKGPANTK